VVAGFNCEHSKRVVNWFNNIVFLSGSNEGMFTAITMKLINESEDFKDWLKKILPELQINDIYIDVVAADFQF
ncbi:hypothetical protein ABKU57_23310, partial (plasmid) [Enterobacter kobei]|uniref:hypothetical protein n=1 Tax=Enterobacter kobei TaxID=208224 RepID=UPI0032AF3573